MPVLLRPNASLPARDGRSASLRRACVFLLLALLASALAHAARPTLLIVHASGDAVSELDARGLREAMAELRTPFDALALAPGSRLPADALEGRTVLALAHVQLDSLDAAEVQAWVQDGGGLFASGRSAFGLEAALGLSVVQALNRERAGLPALDEIRFGVAHPAATGSYWSGPSMQVPPMPGSELPTVPQLLNRALWPAYTAGSTGAEAIARWRSSAEAWTAADAAPAVFAHSFGQGRSLWFGALPGVYSDWQYPLGWREPIQEGLAWVDTRGALIQLGHWPQAKRAAYAFTADTESAAMRTAVPSLLDIFQRLGLADFGTFFIVGAAGGDPGSEGAVDNPEVVQALLAAGAEIAGHGDLHLRFAGQTEAVQTQRLQSMRQLIETSAPGVPALLGFRGPGLAVDRATWRAAATAGLAYDSSDQDVWCECSLPWWTGEVWSLPPTAPMDYILLDRFGLSGAQLQAVMIDKAAYVASRRGLFNWVTHPWVLEGRTGSDMSGPAVRPGVMANVEAILSAARDDGGFWMQRLDAILGWWLQREDLRIELVERRFDRLRLRLHNDGDSAVAGASLWLRLPPADYPWAVQLDGVAASTEPRPHGLVQPIDYRVLVVPQLAAGASAEISLDLQRPAEVFANGFEG